MTRIPTWFRVAARARGLTTLLGLPLLAVALIIDVWPLVIGAGALLVVWLALTLMPTAPQAQAVTVAPPVSGRWIAINSPARRVPSHGTHGYGQTWAIDLVYEPRQGARPAFGGDGWFRPAGAYPGFGRDVLAPADGTVVAARDGARDHRTRSTWPAVALMLVEGMVRELFGPRRLLGNHVVLDLGGGVHAALAHLQRGSIAVARGDRVRAGQAIARCGNSGNSSEPHLHFQLMDDPRPLVAAGLPFTFKPDLEEISE
jgi:murein DD-endopeptidase MepM/ murein hydrolase activator NlpD